MIDLFLTWTSSSYTPTNTPTNPHLALTLLPGKISPKVPFPVPNTRSFVFESPMTSVLLQKFLLIVLNVMEKRSSTGSVISCTKVIKQVAAKISDKRGEQYAHVVAFIRTRLRFSLLGSVLIAVRGVRGKSVKEAHVGFIPLNIIPSCESYDC